MTKKKLTLTSILGDKKIISKKKLTYESEELDAIVELEKVKPSKIANIVSEALEQNEEDYTTFIKLIYESVPLLRSKELIAKYEVPVPYEVVDRIFDRNIKEVYELGNHILSLYGLNPEVQTNIKKL